ncbi:endonuclease/exonuclease/phosphatase family protein [Kiloniella laminariae]|uniref:Endonuclease/exonuclease/phosphatase family protein n=1 Tax=Kiloniella laminariae TaxID=454162 RepID=A0ABT4LGP8_9PROT|nr:endonuclease/exonuclease/phosphatase family protein [Kiloniella laminariae]MCZ4280278.1 endonuclease/exonuclease/phosphatase family protein [Kiloniella laminariae]
MIYFILYAVLSLFLVAATLVPLLPLAHGLVRTFDFPRVQLATLLLVLLFLGPVVFDWTVVLLAFWSLSGFCLAIQLVKIMRYTPFVKVQARTAKAHTIEQERVIKFLVANVLQYNRRYDDLCDRIQQEDADICIFMETDQGWVDALQKRAGDYENRLERAQDNTYGIMLWSKFPLKEAEIRFLVREDIPSILALLSVPESRFQFRLYVVHPEPPDPVSHTVERDAELVMVGMEAADDHFPCIVTGDLNDVAWSRTTERFQKLSGLLDPRIGRGLFSSFHAKYWFARWPLDHLFHSDDFSLVDIKRLAYTGSDHFPMVFEPVFEPETDSENKPVMANGVDKEEAKDLLQAVK